MPSGWVSIVEEDSGQKVSDALDSAFNNIDTDIAGKENIGAKSDIVFSKQVEPVPYAEGRIYYSEDGTINFMGKYPDVVLQGGRENHIDVINNSGGNFINGQVVRYDSVVQGSPAVVLAISDSFDNAGGIGVCTHDIANGNEGVVTSFGRVGNLDLSAFNDGDVLYLSDTVAGGMTTTPPDIATRVGIVFNNDASDGVLFVNPEPNINLPSVLGLLEGQVSPLYNLTAIAQNLDGYSNSESVVMGANSGTGKITLPSTGYYNAIFSASFSFPSSTSTRTVYVELYNETTLQTMFTYSINIPRDSVEDSAGFPKKVLATAGDVFTIRLRSTPDMDITFNDVSFDMESVRI